jgi:hypothetical protein
MEGADGKKYFTDTADPESASATYAKLEIIQ